MNRITLIRIGLIAGLIGFLYILFLALSTERESPLSDSSLGRLIKSRIEQKQPVSKTIVAGEQIYSFEFVGNFYEARSYHPAWSEDGHLVQADQLISAAEEAYKDGLLPS